MASGTEALKILFLTEEAVNEDIPRHKPLNWIYNGFYVVHLHILGRKLSPTTVTEIMLSNTSCFGVNLLLCFG